MEASITKALSSDQSEYWAEFLGMTATHTDNEIETNNSNDQACSSAIEPDGLQNTEYTILPVASDVTRDDALLITDSSETLHFRRRTCRSVESFIGQICIAIFAIFCFFPFGVSALIMAVAAREIAQRPGGQGAAAAHNLGKISTILSIAGMVAGIIYTSVLIIVYFLVWK